MRQTISGLVAAFAVVAASAAPAMACGETPCGQTYIPAPVYSGCNTGCGGWGYERLPDPVQQYYPVQQYPQHQYYYADQGPTYTGPGDFAPYPTYREGAVSGWNGYHHHHHYGYDGGGYGYHSHPYFHHWHAHHDFYGYPEHHSIRYGYAPHHGTYAPHYSQRYHHEGYGYREHTLRRYY
jgi:hypothetical protein